MQSSYSKRQLEEVRYGILQGYDPDEPGIAKCRDCVGGQTVELTCCICDKTKGLDHFSKNQRRDANEAVSVFKILYTSYSVFYRC